MDLTPGRQRALFVGIAVVLVIVGYLVISGRHDATNATPTATPAATQTASPAASAAASAAAASAVASATPVATSGSANIYQWLPFTAADLTAAANTVTAFATDYATWSYKESEAAYGAKLSGLVTSTELTQLETDQYGTAATAQMTADKQVSTGSGTIDAIESFATGSALSITFTVTITSQLASTAPTQSQTDQDWVTVESTASGWEVSDIELTGVGNQ